MGGNWIGRKESPDINEWNIRKIMWEKLRENQRDFQIIGRI